MDKALVFGTSDEGSIPSKGTKIYNFCPGKNHMYRITSYDESMKEEIIRFILFILEGEFQHLGIERPDLYDIPSYYEKFWVALEQNKVIGTIALMKNTEHQGFIKRMCVDIKYRGKGLAQELLSKLIDFANNNSYRELYLSTSANMIAAQKFYDKEGFQKVSSIPTSFKAIGDSIFYKMELDQKLKRNHNNQRDIK